ncbi:unnamed protein product [Blepharisma stoltei]|uniref:Cysteine-rich PDZ-binding protein n=1 Tax=Blepharisma stoltei TaxID=1481888 RepID=A0AAU9J230_9CILI|nr:unnamed protein product [Blepharisma stoltei]
MVCDKCESKLSRLISPDVWKESQPKRGLATNMILSSRAKYRVNPIGTKCRICQKSVLDQHHYCQRCAFDKGICSVCGKKIMIKE